MVHRAFRAMGTDVELFLDSTDATTLLAEAEDEFHRVESLLSRFRPASELSRLNRTRAMQVGPELLELAQLSLEARDQSGGRFDPTVYDALVAAGYDRSFELVAATAVVAAEPARCSGHVTVDVASSTIVLESGFRLDFGGIAKGWTADRALALLERGGPALVNAGGDIASAGRAWPIGVETPDGEITLELDGGALATSGRDRRRWRQGDASQHHVIDPSTGKPAEGELLRVTTVARTATEAEVLAKSLFLRADAAAAAVEADERCAPTILVTRDGRTLLAGGLA
ncbi:MAG: FAD:protein FMN transferase [Thermoleophilia bacterium]|nr:FAD:protein FMN transferase [Thermoleophilia bacterium]MDH4340977.1 FAD:protein FMN transferase [Thermoleophilia bacterium]